MKMTNSQIPMTNVRRRGAAMSEAVMIIPLVVVILALLMYFGKLMVRAERDSMLARYETWRSAQQAPGPGRNEPNGNAHLNSAYFGGHAQEVAGAWDDDVFAEEPYDKLVEHAGTIGGSGNAKGLTQSLLYRAGNVHRYSNGHSTGFTVYYKNTADAWDRMNAIRPDPGNQVNPETNKKIARTFLRIGTDWSYTNDWKAAAADWTGGGGGDWNHPRGVRDTFFADFDSQLDAVDGQASHEYGDSAEPEVPANSLAGMVRRMYLAAPGYGGPTVHY